MVSISKAIYCASVAAIFAGLVATNAYALTNPPTPVTPQQRDHVEGQGCDAPISPTSAQNGYLIRAAKDGLQRKDWQPRGGDIPLTIHVPGGFDNDAVIYVCLRWHIQQPATVKGAEQAKTQEAVPQDDIQKFQEASARVDSISTTTHDPTIVATIPELPAAPPRWQWTASVFDGASGNAALGTYTGLWLVPVADLRILVVGKDGKTKADVIAGVGITTEWWAILLALSSVAAAILLLSRYCKQKIPTLAPRNPLLRIVTTPKGYASLSQFQIVLWTFVVGASVIYVMTLSGELIKVTTGTLVLLGISGASALVSQVQSKNEEAQPTVANANASPNEKALAQKAADDKAAAEKAAETHVTSWCDLVVDGGQINVTRLQMLYFTIIMAAFVGMRVISRYEIPEIPESFLILMGISNGVYVAAKLNK